MLQALSGLLFVGWILSGLALWLAGFAAFWMNYSGIWRLSGMFALPVLALPIIGEGTLAGRPIDTPLWWVGFAVVAVLGLGYGVVASVQRD